MVEWNDRYATKGKDLQIEYREYAGCFAVVDPNGDTLAEDFERKDDDEIWVNGYLIGWRSHGRANEQRSQTNLPPTEPKADTCPLPDVGAQRVWVAEFERAASLKLGRGAAAASADKALAAYRDRFAGQADD